MDIDCHDGGNKSHNCLLTPIVGEGNGAVKVANNGTIMQKCPVAIAKLISQRSAPSYLSLFLLTQDPRTCM